MHRGLSKGLSFKLTIGNVINHSPPLTIDREEMDQALAILDECLTEVSALRSENLPPRERCDDRGTVAPS